jgi:hypothetical protein
MIREPFETAWSPLPSMLAQTAFNFWRGRRQRVVAGRSPNGPKEEHLMDGKSFKGTVEMVQQQ